MYLVPVRARDTYKCRAIELRLSHELADTCGRIRPVCPYVATTRALMRLYASVVCHQEWSAIAPLTICNLSHSLAEQSPIDVLHHLCEEMYCESNPERIRLS
jgi:hypothetical protein